MSNEETLETRQNNEFEALTAIYGDDLKDLRKIWKAGVWEPLDLVIKLTPQQGSSGTHEVYVKTDLHIVCSKKYPIKPPKIILENSRGISNAVIAELQVQLEEKAKKLQGEEMIFQLAQYVQEFLHHHNKPGIKSFYEEMLKRQREEKKAEQLEKDRERQIMWEEIQARQAILKLETRLRRSQHFTSETEETNAENPDSPECEMTVHCDHKNTCLIEFSNNEYRRIHRGRCIEHSEKITFNGIDEESGELVVIHEWIIYTRSNTEHASVQRQISSIEQEFNYLLKLNHCNLVRYLNIKHESTEDKFIVQILQEFVSGSNCASLFYSKHLACDTELMRRIIRGTLSAVDYLHRNNVVHKQINSSSVYINSKGIVKVSSYSIDKKLSDLVNHQQTSSNYNKKTDIYRIGVLILSLLHGSNVNEDNIEIPETVSHDFYDFLQKCLIKDEKIRFTATQLLNHAFLQAPIIPCSPKHIPETTAPVRAVSPENPSDDMKLLLNQGNALGQSRVQNDFEFLQHIGTGAYGDVIKVRNNLDGCYYAIKRIELNPKNKQLNKKILREVKLLSRLNHENVVRYYNSWIETALIENENTDFSQNIQAVSKIPNNKELTFKDDIEALAPPMRSMVDWLSDAKSSGLQDTSSSVDDSTDDENIWMINTIESSDTDVIQFENDGSTEKSADGTPSTVSKTSSLGRDSADTTGKNIKEKQFMYIQMEFCEKSTLRTAIDNNLYLEEDRMWRLFREIVEGLAHIHQQGMIHRDLKPVNIFLDSNDHVKIGDFGLATTSMRTKPSDPYSTSRSLQESEKEDVTGSLTGQVGTALYVAPELSFVPKAVYNQKVDIYSLGIILFEMCYRSLNTSMERIKILSQLRTKDVIFPEDFKKRENEKKEFLIRWLLNHDVSKRPTSQELLQSEHIPPPLLEERELRELVRHTLSNPQLKAYKYLVASCFKQSSTPAQDITYDRDPIMPNFTRPSQLYEIIKQLTIRIFKLHGGQTLSTPLLMPKSKYYEKTETCVKLMTHSGFIVSIPHDLRVPFARYVASNGITLLRRYSVEKVYREKKVFGFLPRELYECAFDIVTPSKGNFMSDAEILCIVSEIINDIPGLKNKNFVIHINHTSLIKAILLHCGVKEKHEDVYNIISQFRDGKMPKLPLQSCFASFGLSDNSITTLINLITGEFEINKAINIMQIITKRKTAETSQMAKLALQELKAIIANAEALGVTFDIVVTPGLVYNMQHYSGMICQFVCELKKKHKRNSMDVLAAGGRYDNMIADFRNIMEQANMLSKDIQQSAVGVSISLDKVVQAIQEEQSIQEEQLLDVVVCSLGTKTLLKEKAKILKSLWSSGIRCCLIDANNIEEIQEQCNELKVPHVIILKDTEQGTVRLRSWEKDRFQEKTFKTSDLIKNIRRHLRTWNDICHYEQNANGSFLARSESKSSNSEKNEHSHDATVAVLFVTSDKLSSNVRRRYDNQIRSQLEALFKRLNGDIVVLGVNAESSIIRTIASYISFENEHQFHESVSGIVEKHARHQMYLHEICNEIFEHKLKRTNPIIILYSLSDSVYKLLL